MKISQGKLPVKYALNVFREMDGFPSHEDLVYILLSNLSDRDEIENLFTPSQVWPYMKDALGTVSDLIGFLDYVSDPTECPSAFLQKVSLTEGKKPEWQYKVIDNPWL